MNTQSVLEILLKTKKTGDGEKQATTEIQKLNGVFKEATGFSLSAAGGIAMAAVAVKKIAQELNECEQAAVEAEKAQAKLNAVITSTSGAAGMTAEELDSLATAISKTTGLDDELLTSAEAVLLTYTRISSEVFPETMQAAADMAAVLGGDVQTRVEMLGKALNDFSGYTKLSRIIGGFTDDQQSVIEGFEATNDLIGYQEYMLGILEEKFSGAAEAINEAGDHTENMKVAVGNLQEAIGTGLIPTKRKWNDLIISISENLAENINEINEYNDALTALGIVQVTNNVYQKDGVRISYEQMAAMVAASKAAAVASDRYDQMSGSIEGVTEATEEEIAAISEANESRLSEIENWTKIEEDFAEDLEGLYGDRKTLELELQDLRNRGYSDEGQKIQDVLTRMGEIDTEIENTKAAYELKTNTVILGYMKEKLAADGTLTDEETKWLIKKGVEWGIYSEKALETYELASAAADEFLKHRQASEYDNVVTVTTRYISIHEDYGSGSAPNNNVNNIKGYAAGGVASGLTLVGENGIEMVDLPNGSYVYNNTTTKNILQGGSGALAGNNTTVYATIMIDGAQDPRAVVDEMMDELNLQGVNLHVS